MWLKELILIIIITTAGATSTIAFNENATILNENFKETNRPNEMINLINDFLKSLKWHVNKHDAEEETQNISQQLAELQINNDFKELEKSLKFLFKKTIASNWQTKDALQVIASAANDVTVYEILYEVLWQELRSDPNKANPFLFMDLYNELKSVRRNITSDKLQKLQKLIQIDLENSSATILQSFFIRNETVWQLLAQLKDLNTLHRTTIPRVFENLNNIEDQWYVATCLLEFDSNTEEAVYNHISYIKYLKSRHDIIPYELYNNLELLIARQNFVNISAQQRQISNQLLPHSMASLFATDKICIRNTTQNLYLYECPQTYLMCTNFIANSINPINRKKAVFEFERNGKGQYILRSPYWSRYLHLQTTNSKNITSSGVNDANGITNTTILKITKNLYSSSELSFWHIRFQGDFVTIQDSTGDFYICGGNSVFWSSMEKHAYTRQSISSNDIQRECLWLLEDCSDVTF